MARHFTKMSNILETLCFLVLLFAGIVHSRERRATTNPCTSYQVLNNTFLDVSFTRPTNNDSYLLYMTWYRYLYIGQGSLALTCPNDNACGTNRSIWMNGTIPSISEGAKDVKVCYKNETSCCGSSGIVRIANCGTFLVYFLMSQNPPTRWCFDKSATPLAIPKEEGSNIGLIAGAAGGGVVAVGAVVGVVIFIRKKMKSNAVNATKPDSNSDEADKGTEKQANGH